LAAAQEVTMNEPKQPVDPDTSAGTSAAANPDGTTPNGTPKCANAEEPKGTPDADRAKTETAFQR